MTATHSAPVLAGLYRYPIKSTAGQALGHVRVGEEGLEADRRYMVAKPDGTFLTGRRYPALLRIAAAPVEGGLRITHPELEAIEAHEHEFAAEPIATAVWRDEFDALTTTPELDEWFSAALRAPVKLLWVGHRSRRRAGNTGQRLSFADGYPLLLISQASLDELNARMPRSQVMAQFRPNLVVSGTAAFAEDRWKRIRIGGLELSVAKSCDRCAMVTIDPATAEFMPNNEPLRTLARFRREPGGKILFGQNLVPLGEGELEIGAPVQVLEESRIVSPGDA